MLEFLDQFPYELGSVRSKEDGQFQEGRKVYSLMAEVYSRLSRCVNVGNLLKMVAAQGASPQLFGF